MRDTRHIPFAAEVLQRSGFDVDVVTPDGPTAHLYVYVPSTRIEWGLEMVVTDYEQVRIDDLHQAYMFLDLHKHETE